MTDNPNAIPSSAAAPRLQLVAATRKRRYAKRMPSTLTPYQRQWAVDSMRAGRSAHVVAYELSCAEIVVLELFLRDLAREWRRAAA